jgi:hypothetical protein
VKLGNDPILSILANRVPEKNVGGLTGARDVQYKKFHPGHVSRDFVRLKSRFDGMTLKPN